VRNDCSFILKKLGGFKEGSKTLEKLRRSGKSASLLSNMGEEKGKKKEKEISP